jgi:hypothetical protein
MKSRGSVLGATAGVALIACRRAEVSSLWICSLRGPEATYKLRSVVSEEEMFRFSPPPMPLFITSRQLLLRPKKICKSRFMRS